MGKVTDKIRLIMVQENLSAMEVFEKYLNEPWNR